MPITDLFQQLKAAFESRDLANVMALFANDAVVIDPHYPQPEMRGKTAIKQGFEWAFGNIEKPGFTERHIWTNETSGVIEVNTHHIFRGGMKLAFQQVFVIETRNGLITRLQSYPSYGPHGIGGMLTKLVRLMWRIQGKLK